MKKTESPCQGSTKATSVKTAIALYRVGLGLVADKKVAQMDTALKKDVTVEKDALLVNERMRLMAATLEREEMVV